MAKRREEKVDAAMDLSSGTSQVRRIGQTTKMTPWQPACWNWTEGSAISICSESLESFFKALKALCFWQIIRLTYVNSATGCYLPETGDELARQLLADGSVYAGEWVGAVRHRSEWVLRDDHFVMISGHDFQPNFLWGIFWLYTGHTGSTLVSAQFYKGPPQMTKQQIYWPKSQAWSRRVDQAGRLLI